MSSVKYKSTRGGSDSLSFEDVVMRGLAEDGGLFVPETIPAFTVAQIENMRTLSFQELAYEIISKFIHSDEIDCAELQAIINKSFLGFRSAEVTPCKKCKTFWVLELFHGPTFAFKDVALQFLGNIFEHFLVRGRKQKTMTILGATSGDTGSAAIHGLRGKSGIDCFIMFPTGKVTEIQERQMTTVPDSNIHCIGIDGDFDDCQALVKAAFADSEFRKEVNLGAVNSINWARVLAQITYYFYSYLRVTDNDSNTNTNTNTNAKVSYAVPTGNFGDILAGFYARRMGLPIDTLTVCTNQNDVLHRFFRSGEYRRTPAEATLAPSMDISVSSNFERYLYYLAGEDHARLRAWMSTFETTGAVSVAPDDLVQARSEFSSYSASGNTIIQTMRELFEDEAYLVCPHTATAVAAVVDQSVHRERCKRAIDNGNDSDSVHVCLATAHPAKFELAVHKALYGSVKDIPARPVELEELFALETRKVSLPGSLGDVIAYIRSKNKNCSNY